MAGDGREANADAGGGPWRRLLRRPDLKVAGSRVLITGGSRGLGFALARQFGQRGAHVALLARDADALRGAREQLRRELGVEVAIIACDLRDRAETERAVTQLIERWHRLDVLINNAGIVQPGPAEQKQLHEYEEAMAVHFWAPLQLMRAVLPTMRAQAGGRIVNVSSIEGKVAFPYIAPYCASKFALTGLSNALRAELARERIYITTVAPGLIGPSVASGAESRSLGRVARGLLTVDYALAARRIVRACCRGQRWLELDRATRLAIWADAVAPSVLGATMELAADLLAKRFARPEEASHRLAARGG